MPAEYPVDGRRANDELLVRSDELLVRIDERTRSTDKNIERLDENFKNYVTKHEFGPVKLIAYGLAIAVLAGVVNAIIGLAIVQPVEQILPYNPSTLLQGQTP